MSRQPLPLDQRRTILQREISGYLRRGFRVQSQTETTAQLVKPKKFSLLWAVLWFFVFGVGLVLYLLYYLSKKDETVYLEVGEAGQVKRIGAGGLSGGGLRLFGLSSTGTLILCGGCLAFSIILGLFNSTNEATQTQPATAVAVAATASTAPTEIPLPTATFTPPPIIIDFSAILNSSVEDVEKYLGKPSEIIPIKAGEYPQELPDGGDGRTYYLDDFTVYVFYDKQKVAKNVFMFGLEKYGYKMDAWPTLMPRLGFPIDSPPDRVAQAGRHWENYNGYGISLQANSLDGPIDFAKIFIVP